jgi:hypothetical protein
MKKYLSTIIPVFLFLIFLVLKITKIIDWSWWLVFSPVILLFALYVFIAIYIITLKDDMPDEVLHKH